MTAAPLTQSEKVQRSQSALAARGGRRVHISLQPGVAQALDALLASGYAHTASAVIAKALLQAHSKAKPIQLWDFISGNGIPYLEGNAIKYLCRHREKGGVADLEKAKHYIEKLIEISAAAEPASPSQKIDDFELQGYDESDMRAEKLELEAELFRMFCGFQEKTGVAVLGCTVRNAYIATIGGDERVITESVAIALQSV